MSESRDAQRRRILAALHALSESDDESAIGISDALRRDLSRLDEPGEEGGVMESAWIVTEGEYSDYNIRCVCPSQEEARRVAERIGARVEEVPLVTLADVHTVSVLRLTCTVEGGTGLVRFETERVDLSHALGEDPDEPEVRAAVDATPRVWLAFGPFVSGYEVFVYGTDHERVRKAYSERKAKAQAQALEVAAAIEASKRP